MLSLLILVGFAFAVQAQFQKCDQILKINLVGQTIIVNYPGTSQAGTSCRYQIIAPVNSVIDASCTFNIAGTQPSCTTQNFRLSRSGDRDTRDANSLCGRGSTLQRSIGNEMTLTLTSSKLQATSFYCSFKSIAPTNANCECGWNVRGRIVGGSAAGVNEFVSHAGLVDQATKDVFCGAIILTQNWALTAAHCFDAFRKVGTSALLVGDHDVSTGSDTIWAALYLLQSYIKHDGYSSETNANDIALIKTLNYIKFNRGVGPACLPYTFMNANNYFDGKYLTSVGWGSTEYGGPASKILKKAQLQVVNIQTCAQKNQFATNANICTSESNAGSTCSRDSGGGLYWSPGRQYAIGIVSYGTYCASSIPSVNIRITSYIGWIESVVKEFLCRKT